VSVVLNARLEKIKHILMCPSCHGDLGYESNRALCLKCTKSYSIVNGKIYFIQVPTSSDSLDALKGKLKKLLGKYYYSIGIRFLAPTYPFNYLKEIKKRAILDKLIVVDVGCGNHRIHPDIICLDMFDYEAVDVVCDLDHLPFRHGTVDVFASRSVIEHIPNPTHVIQKMYECTKQGGYSIHCIPFLFPFHASPHDFQRYTHKGLDKLFDVWNKVDQRNITGPVSAMLANTIEFLSILLSIGNKRLQPFLYLMFCLLLFPIKYLDWFFVPSKKYYSLAASFLMVVQKNNSV